MRSLAPIAVNVAKRYRMGPEVFPDLLEAVENSAPVLALTIISLLVLETLERDDRLRLREPLFRIISALGGTSLLDRMTDAARLGIRLDAKLGRTDASPWNDALLEGLKKTISGGEHTLLREEAAQQAAFILQKLGLVEERAAMIPTQRELAQLNRPTWSHSESIDEDGTVADFVRTDLDRYLAQSGEMGVLTYLGLSASIMPKMENARNSLQQQFADGIGVFRQIFKTTVRSRDDRVIGHASVGGENMDRALTEQFGYGCIYAWYAMDVAAHYLISNGTVRHEHFDMLLKQTWINIEETGRSNDLVFLLSVPLEGYIDVVTGERKASSLILTIDSLTMRLEAVLRKLARLHMVADTKETQDQRGRLVTEVLGLSQVLKQPQVAAVLGEDLVALVRRTLVGEDEGLRDRIGHAITDRSDYDIFTGHKLVFLLLRLAMVERGTAGVEGRVTF